MELTNYIKLIIDDALDSAQHEDGRQYHVEVTPAGDKIAVTHLSSPVGGSECSPVELTNEEFHHFNYWLQGTGKAQDIMGSIDADRREYLMSGTPVGFWSAMFPEEDE